MSEIDKRKTELGIRADEMEIEITIHESGNVERVRFIEEIEENPQNNPAAVETDMELIRLSNEWTSTCIGFFEAAPELSLSAQIINNRSVESSTVSYVKDKALSERSDGENITIYTLPERERSVVSGKIRDANRFRRVTHIYRDSLLLALIAEYENLIRRITLQLYRNNPRKFIGSGVKVDAIDLFESNTIEEVQEKLILERTDTLLRESHITQLQMLGKQIDKDFLTSKALVSEFSEICERRNLITHNGGIVNERYLNNCIASGSKPDDLPELGKRISVSDQYLMRAIGRVFLFGFFPIHMIIQKMVPSSTQNSIETCNTAAHDFLLCDLTKMASRVCNFALQSAEKQGTEKQKVYLTINLALSFLLNDTLTDNVRKDEVENVLSSRDWSIKDEATTLALACVREDYSNINEQVIAAVRAGVGYWEFSTWSLFKKARLNPAFKKAVSDELGMTFG